MNMKIADYIVKSDISIREAIKHMDKFMIKICVVVNKNFIVRGVFTEGDFRKAVYSGKDLNSKVDTIINKNFFFVNSRNDKDRINNIFAKNIVTCIPILRNRKLIDVVMREQVFLKTHHKNKKIPVVIMAGGRGTRLEPFTKILPKPLFPLGGEPIVTKIINQFRNFGFDNFYLSIYDKSQIIKAYFKNPKKFNISFIEEKNPMGTIGSLKLMKNKFKGTFIISNCDILVKTDFNEIIKYHRKNKNDLTIIGSMRHYEIPYGVCELNKSGKLKKIIEKPSNDYLVNTGVYIAESKIIKIIGKKKQMDTDELISNLIHKKFKIGVFPISSESWQDYGQWSEIKRNRVFN